MGRSDGRHHARIRFHSAGTVAASAGRTASGIRPRGRSSRRPRAPFWRGSCPTADSISTPQGPSEISATVKAYTRAEAGRPRASTIRICSRRANAFWRCGGLQAANSYVKINLSLFGLYPREHVPSIPPELMLLGKLIYEMSSWTRAIVIPLSIVHAHESAAPGAGRILAEGTVRCPACRCDFPTTTRLLQLAQFLPQSRPDSEVLGAARFARIRAARRSAHGRAVDARAHAQFRRRGRDLSAHDVRRSWRSICWGIPKTIPSARKPNSSSRSCWWTMSGAFFFQPCFSPVWDTAIAAYALGESGRASPQARFARGRLAADQRSPAQGRLVGQAARRPSLPAGTFEFANEFYPDIDDTAQVLLASEHARAASDAAAQRATAAARRATGCSPCSRKTAAGRHSTSTITGIF